MEEKEEKEEGGRRWGKGVVTCQSMRDTNTHMQGLRSRWNGNCESPLYHTEIRVHLHYLLEGHLAFCRLELFVIPNIAQVAGGLSGYCSYVFIACK